MDLLFKNKTSVDVNMNLNLNKLTFKKNTFKMLLFYEIALVVFLIYTLITKSFILSIVIGALIVIFVLLGFITYKISNNKIKKKYETEIKNLDFDYEFYDESFKVQLDFNGAINNIELKYEFVSKIYIDSENYYMFIKNNSCYIISKKEFGMDFDKDKFLSLFSNAKVINIKEK